MYCCLSIGLNFLDIFVICLVINKIKGLKHESHFFCILQKESVELCNQRHGTSASRQSMDRLASAVLIVLILERSKTLLNSPMKKRGAKLAALAIKESTDKSSKKARLCFVLLYFNLALFSPPYDGPFGCQYSSKYSLRSFS